MNTQSELSLWYGTMLVGQIKEAFSSDATWHGVFEPQVDPADGPVARRVWEFIEFCERWNDRVRASPEEPPDATEFDRYTDVLKSGLWRTKDALGQENQIAEAPVFFRGGEVSWHLENVG
jgi:hypothetical protein